MKNPVYPREEDQILRFMEIVYTMRVYQIKDSKQESFLCKQKIAKAEFMIDQMLQGRKINGKFEVIPETTQENFFSDTRE